MQKLKLFALMQQLVHFIRIRLCCLGPWFSCSQKLLADLSFQSFDFERTWWTLLQKPVMRTKLISTFLLLLNLCSPWHCLFFLLLLQTYSLFAMALSVLLVTPSNLFSVLHGIVCSSCYPFKLILCSPWHCLFFLLPLQTYSLFAMALSVLLVTPSNLFSVLHDIVCSSCYPFKLILCSPWHCLFYLLPLQT